MRLLAEQSLAIAIDIQERLFPHMFEQEHLKTALPRIIQIFSHLNIPILLTEQYKKGLGDTIPEVLNAFSEVPKDQMRPEKKHFSALDDDAILMQVQQLAPRNLLIFGIESHVCVLQTAIDAKDLGYQPVVIVDAISSRKASDKEIALERLKAEGIRLTTIEAIAFELCRVSGTDTFKAISKLVK